MNCAGGREVPEGPIAEIRVGDGVSIELVLHGVVVIGSEGFDDRAEGFDGG